MVNCFKIEWLKCEKNVELKKIWKKNDLKV